MTTEDDFQSALDADPDAWHARMVFADWLEDRDDPRAEGYRAIALHRRSAFGTNRPDGRGCWWHRDDGNSASNNIPHDWFALLPSGEGSNLFWPLYKEGRPSMSRRACDDALALAFARLPADRRAELLTSAGTGVGS